MNKVERIAETELESRSQFELLLAELSARFINLPSDQVHSAIEEAQRVLCERLDLDRSSLFQCSEEGDSMLLLTHLYQRPGSPSQILKAIDPSPQSERRWRLKAADASVAYTRIDAREMHPWFFAQLRRGQTVVVPDVQALGEEAAKDRKNMAAYETKSTVAVPLFSGGIWLGVLTFATIRECRDWPDALVKRFQFLGDVFSNALARKRADDALRESEERFRVVADSAPVLIWMAGSDKLCTYCNKAWLDFTGRTAEQEMGNGWAESVHPEDLPACLKVYIESFDARRSFSMHYRLRRHDGEYRWISDHGVPRHDAEGAFAGYIGSCVDITERKVAEENLSKSLAEIESLKIRLQAERDYLRTEIKVTQSFGEIIGQNKGVKRVLHQIEQVAPADCPVLISGETGTGKELIARAIHRLSPRKDRAMVKVNCAALPSPLVESELFGRERGAFTGAMTSQAGRFEVADHSTIFLDEVGELSLEVQAKLLRVLQEGEFERLGSPHVRKVDARVIAASNRDLAEAVRQGKFRQDLYYRLSVFPIKVSPLRERPEDIPALVSTFVTEFASRMGKKITKLPRRTMEALQRYSWPGNIRELRNVIERSVIISSGEILRIAQLQEMQQTSHPITLAENEREHILKVLEKNLWHIKGPRGAAKELGLKPSTLYTRMQKLGIPNRRQRDGMLTYGRHPAPDSFGKTKPSMASSGVRIS